MLSETPFDAIQKASFYVFKNMRKNWSKIFLILKKILFSLLGFDFF